MVPAANGEHRRGQVTTDRVHATAGQPGRDVPGAAPQVGDRQAIFSLLGKAGQQGPVEWLGGELIAKAGHVLLGDDVVALAGGLVARDGFPP